ncbi:uncharacterized protein AMSG_04430 [Thecamonas trahens ATCC 50062]|uniref:Uncharacterized protein n=1 Tax=Thecamonas trahens ATCC 50062 TaxID=461836 RepID=A0A0L0D807_THETB|nr:hypothetical protein AMSG_04430 [Thecamonas trahens ATCC 50062]KNC48201.1 hypothetical protein AMSG_04430 [Thecamonas trahens ATCC 50062]|eukprot:XP_013758770.1 hypothetical protein AMSG_04430 [Thecamonas trahens ATCC 50062]
MSNSSTVVDSAWQAAPCEVAPLQTAWGRVKALLHSRLAEAERRAGAAEARAREAQELIAAAEARTAEAVAAAATLKIALLDSHAAVQAAQADAASAWATAADRKQVCAEMEALLAETVQDRRELELSQVLVAAGDSSESMPSESEPPRRLPPPTQAVSPPQPDSVPVSLTESEASSRSDDDDAEEDRSELAGTDLMLFEDRVALRIGDLAESVRARAQDQGKALEALRTTMELRGYMGQPDAAGRVVALNAALQAVSEEAAHLRRRAVAAEVALVAAAVPTKDALLDALGEAQRLRTELAHARAERDAVFDMHDAVVEALLLPADAKLDSARARIEALGTMLAAKSDEAARDRAGFQIALAWRKRANAKLRAQLRELQLSQPSSIQETDDESIERLRIRLAGAEAACLHSSRVAAATKDSLIAALGRVQELEHKVAAATAARNAADAEREGLVEAVLLPTDAKLDSARARIEALGTMLAATSDDAARDRAGFKIALAWQRRTIAKLRSESGSSTKGCDRMSAIKGALIAALARVQELEHKVAAATAARNAADAEREGLVEAVLLPTDAKLDSARARIEALGTMLATRSDAAARDRAGFQIALAWRRRVVAKHRAYIAQLESENASLVKALEEARAGGRKVASRLDESKRTIAGQRIAMAWMRKRLARHQVPQTSALQ